MQSRVYETVQRPSVCLSHQSTVAAVCGMFAAEHPGHRRYRLVAGTALSSSNAAAWLSAANVGSVTLTADIGG